MDLDNYINGLLVSENQNDKIIGYLSVVFWGFYSGQDGIIRQNRALGKVNLAYFGRDRVVRGNQQRMRGVIDYDINFVVGHINNAIDYVDADNFSEALRSLTNLPQLQVAFASKVCAFIDPAKCGVIDSVIAENHPQLGFTVDNAGIVTNRVANRNNYNHYCEYLQVRANEINQNELPFMWTDRDGNNYDWRALDVERSMY